jgi:hypothetical protein
VLPTERARSATGRYVALAITALRIQLAQQAATARTTGIAIVTLRGLAADAANQNECRRGEHDKAFHRGIPFRVTDAVQ